MWTLADDSGLNGVKRTATGGRSFIWLDDEITDAGRRWIAAHYAGHALLLRVDPHVGLTEFDFSVIGQWLAE